MCCCCITIIASLLCTIMSVVIFRLARIKHISHLKDHFRHRSTTSADAYRTALAMYVRLMHMVISDAPHISANTSRYDVPTMSTCTHGGEANGAGTFTGGLLRDADRAQSHKGSLSGMGDRLPIAGGVPHDGAHQLIFYDVRCLISISNSPPSLWLLQRFWRR